MIDPRFRREFNIEIAVKHFKIAFPTVTEPAWAGSVARWHQLDDATFAVVEAAYRFSVENTEVWESVRPKSMWIASPGGSNSADCDFVQHGSRSPSRFVGTLPSIRSSSLALFMDWQGPVICLQSGGGTMAQGFEEICWHLRGQSSDPAWLITSTRKLDGGKAEHLVSFFCFASQVKGDFVCTHLADEERSDFLNHIDLIAQCEDGERRAISVGMGITLNRK